MKNKAFTLIELLVVIVIIGILATITTSTFGDSRKKARDAAKIASLSSSFVEAEAFSSFIENNDSYQNTCSRTDLSAALIENGADCFDSPNAWAIQVDLEASHESTSNPYYCIDGFKAVGYTNGPTVDVADFMCDIISSGGGGGGGNVANGDPCGSYGDCESGFCNLISGVCVSSYTDEFNSCSNSSDCESGICAIFGTCGTGLVGSDCGSNADCRYGFTCADGTSCTDGEIGSPCYYNSECNSNWCNGWTATCKASGSAGTGCYYDDSQCSSNSCNTSSNTCD